MIKLTFCLRRRPDLSREAFYDYWLNRHGPLVRRHQAALRMRRYVQVHGRELELVQRMAATRGAPEPYDGVAELWWDRRGALLEALSTPEGREAGGELLEDEKRFIDTERSPLWVAQEHPVLEGSP